MPTQTEIREQITEKLIAALENNIMPWRRPWSQSKNTGRPANVTSKKNYSGINPLLLELDAMKKGFHSRWWATFHQWKQLDCRVMKRPDHVEPGQWGTNIIFFRPIEKKTTDVKTGEEKDDKFFLMRTFCVFNAD
jgi:antirestriction protein ArdC